VTVVDVEEEEEVLFDGVKAIRFFRIGVFSFGTFVDGFFDFSYSNMFSHVRSYACAKPKSTRAKLKCSTNISNYSTLE
jgi:hypothetical protein